jgi:hypothetical protein
MRNRKKGTGRGRKLRVFAWVLALGLALLGWGVFARTPAGFALQVSAAVVFAVGATWPYAFARLYRVVGPAAPHPSPPAGQG